MVEIPSRRSGSGRDSLLVVQGWSGDPLGGPGVVGGPPKVPELIGRPCRWYGTDWETIPKVRKWSGDPLGGLELVGTPS